MSEQTGAYVPSEPALPVGVPATAGRYVVRGEIARGGMGVVYRAFDPNFDREVAVKVLRADLIGSTAAGRFFAEARVTAQLQHPSVPPVHEVGTLPDGRPFLAMKLIQGRTFADVLSARGANAEDFADHLRVFEQICLAVAFAHARGIVHRDLKPANVMVGAFGEVQVMDWGLAKTPASGGRQPVVDFTVNEPTVPLPISTDTIPHIPADTADETRAGTVLGTLAFMPPEQARGELDRVDARSDVFALGGILCVMLTGKPPYTGATSDEVYEKAVGARLDIAFERLTRSAAKTAVAKLAKRCLAPRPDDRPAHAGEVAVALAAIAAGADELRKLDDRRQADDVHAKVIDELRATAARDRLRVRGLFLFGLFGLAVAVAALSWSGVPRMPTKSAADALPNRETLAAEYLPLALESVRRDVSAGNFRRGWDGAGRDAAVRRVTQLLPGRSNTEKAKAYVLLAAAMDAVPDDAAGDQYWWTARGFLEAEDHADVRLAVLAVSWHVGKAPDAVDKKALARALKVLTSATGSTLPPDLAESVATAKKAATK